MHPNPSTLAWRLGIFKPLIFFFLFILVLVLLLVLVLILQESRVTWNVTLGPTLSASFVQTTCPNRRLGEARQDPAGTALTLGGS